MQLNTDRPLLGEHPHLEVHAYNSERTNFENMSFMLYVCLSLRNYVTLALGLLAIKSKYLYSGERTLDFYKNDL